MPIGLLGAAGFLSSAGARVIDSLLYAIAVDFRVSIPQVSVVIAAFTLPYGLNQIVLGPVGDRFGKLRVLLGALIGYAVATAACALATSLPMLTVLRMMAGASSAGLIPVSLAYIGDMVPYKDRQVTMSRFLTGVVLAQMVAGPVGGFFGEAVSWRGVFLLLAAVAVVVALLLAVRIGHLPDRRCPDASFHPRNYAVIARDGRARLLLLGTLVDGMLFTGSFPFIAPFLTAHFGVSYAGAGLILACFGIGAFGYTHFARRLVPCFGEPGLVLLGGGVIVLGLAIGMTSPTWIVFPLVEVLLGLGYFMLHSVLQARATEILPQARGTAVSSFVFMLFMGQSLGALAMGAAIAWLGYHRGFWLVALGTALLSIGLARLLARTHPHPA
jgi:predicted MFS family arabinose efflux permease